MRILFWRGVVCLFMLLAIIGAILPGMPTTVFLILAAWAASKGWPQMDAWLLAHPKYGSTLRNWREHGTVPRKVKLLACGMMLLSGTLMLLTNAPFWVKVFTNVTMLMVAIWLCLRPEPQSAKVLSPAKHTADDANSFAIQYQALLAAHQSYQENMQENMQQSMQQSMHVQALYHLQDAEVIVDLTRQQLLLPKHQKIYRISSAKNGIGEQVGSGKTPRGWHQVCEKFGADAPQNAVFVARQWTGEIYTPELAQQFPERDWILSRILWLDGLQIGFNAGEGCDSKSRYIYIHGTPDTEPMGVPCSHGCIRMRNVDVIELFALVQLNARVCILP